MPGPADGELLPGGFATVAFEVPSAVGTPTLPPSALVFDEDDLRVATVGDGDRVVMKPARIA